MHAGYFIGYDNGAEYTPQSNYYTATILDVEHALHQDGTEDGSNYTALQQALVDAKGIHVPNVSVVLDVNAFGFDALNTIAKAGYAVVDNSGHFTLNVAEFYASTKTLDNGYFYRSTFDGFRQSVKQVNPNLTNKIIMDYYDAVQQAARRAGAAQASAGATPPPPPVILEKQVTVAPQTVVNNLGLSKPISNLLSATGFINAAGEIQKGRLSVFSKNVFIENLNLTQSGAAWKEKYSDVASAEDIGNAWIALRKAVGLSTDSPVLAVSLKSSSSISASAVQDILMSADGTIVRSMMPVQDENGQNSGQQIQTDVVVTDTGYMGTLQKVDSYWKRKLLLPADMKVVLKRMAKLKKDVRASGADTDSRTDVSSKFRNAVNQHVGDLESGDRIRVQTSIQAIFKSIYQEDYWQSLDREDDFTSLNGENTQDETRVALRFFATMLGDPNIINAVGQEYVDKTRKDLENFLVRVHRVNTFNLSSLYWVPEVLYSNSPESSAVSISEKLTAPLATEYSPSADRLPADEVGTPEFSDRTVQYFSVSNTNKFDFKIAESMLGALKQAGSKVIVNGANGNVDIFKTWINYTLFVRLGNDAKTKLGTSDFGSYRDKIDPIIMNTLNQIRDQSGYDPHTLNLVLHTIPGAPTRDFIAEVKKHIGDLHDPNKVQKTISYLEGKTPVYAADLGQDGPSQTVVDSDSTAANIFYLGGILTDPDIISKADQLLIDATRNRLGDNSVKKEKSYQPYIVQKDQKEAFQSPDSAMNGGINLDAAQLSMEIKRDGQGMPLPMSFQNPDLLNIKGLFPVVLSIQLMPVSDIPHL